MNNISELVSTPAFFIVSAIVCALLVLSMSRVGRSLGLVDRPCERKKHVGEIPLVGGLAICTTLLVLGPLSGVNAYVLAGGVALALLGLADDVHDLDAKLRLFIQILVAFLVIHFTGIKIESLGNLLNDREVILTGGIATIFTIFCIVGVINAINMIDGADGLSGGVVFISVGALLYLSASATGASTLTVNLITLLGAVAAFLVFNCRLFGEVNKVFLGDAGSMFLGLVLCIYFVSMSQGENALLSPVVAGWVLGLPLIDTISVMVGRITRGSSPLSASRDHVHHLLIDNGFSAKATVIIILALHCTIVTMGLLANKNTEAQPAMFWAFVALVILHHFITPKLVAWLKQSNLTALCQRLTR